MFIQIDKQLVNLDKALTVTLENQSVVVHFAGYDNYLVFNFKSETAAEVAFKNCLLVMRHKQSIFFTIDTNDEQ